MKMEIKNISDYELIYMARQNDAQAFQILYSRYEKLIWNMTHNLRMNNTYISFEQSDIYCEVMNIFAESIQTYRIDMKATFGTYAYMCIQGNLAKYLRMMRKRMNEMQVVVEDNSQFYTDWTQNIEDYSYDPAKKLSYKWLKEIIALDLEKIELNEQIILQLYLDGHAISEIKRETNYSIYSIKKTIAKFRNRISKVVENVDYN